MAPRAIFIIRHGEKSPDSGVPAGVDIDGEPYPDSLIPQGWQRAGALASLFDPLGQLTVLSELVVPTTIATPDYPHAHKHRTYQTVLPTARKLQLTPSTDFAVGREAQLTDWLLGQDDEVVLVCWEHDHIIDITDALEPHIVSGPVPGPWPPERFDIVVALWPAPDIPGSYVCSQVPQLLLAGDSSAIIPPAS